MREDTLLLDRVPGQLPATGDGWSDFYVEGDPAIPAAVWAGARGWSADGHLPAFVVGVALGGGQCVIGVLRRTREGLRVRVERVGGESRLSGVFSVHVAGSSGVVYAGDDDAEIATRVRALPRRVVAVRSWDELWVSEQEELGLDRLESPSFDDPDVAVALESGDALSFRAVAHDLRDALFALAAMSGASYVVH